jgi:hypothetical protein
VLAEVDVEEIELQYFEPLAERYHLAIEKGTLSTTGDVEYAAHLKRI